MKLISKETIQKYTQTVGERNEIDEILVPILLPSRISGLQILDPDWSWKKYVVNRLFSVAISVYVAIGTIDCCSKTDDMNVVIEGIFTMIFVGQMILKLSLFAQNRDKFQNNFMKAKNFIYDLIRDLPEKRDKIKKNLKYSVNILMSLVLLLIVSYTLLALSSYGGTRKNLSASTSILMPMTSPYYELGLLLHLCFLTEAAFNLLVIDMWYVFICFFFLECGDQCIQILKEKRGDDNREVYAKRLDSALRKFYNVHIELMEYLNMLNGIYKWICMLPMGANLIGNCIFLMTMEKGINYRLLTVMLPCTGQIFTYNLFGKKITSKADEIKMALLHFEWTSMNLKDQKKYYIMVCYMNKKFAVTTATGTDLSLLTLSNFYKASYQMFTVFRTT